jgi:hypothetical protein
MTPAAFPESIGLDSVVTASRNQVSSDLSDEKIILGVDTGRYYGLRGVGVRIWDLLGEPRRVAEIRDILVSEFDVEPARCERDLLQLLEQLADRGLIDVRDAQGS